jgi:putative ATPase
MRPYIFSGMDLFTQHARDLVTRNAPLADRMRPRTLDEFIGQEQIIGPGRLLRRAIQIDQLSSLIFYGPPGCGKTTLARIIANTTKAEFISINAVLAGIKEIREAVEAARQTIAYHSRRTILFIDEVHRFNKAQQDALLPHVENGLLTLIGATTENPYFEVNKALVSRSRIFSLATLGEDDLRRVAHQALDDKERGYGLLRVELAADAEDHLVRVANGDARGVLNALELAVETTAPGSDGIIHITAAVAEDSIQQRAVLYDKDGDAHYDTISAFIKSMRGSDPDAALYWMAKMIYAGEDPRFIFRRMLILACEDVGLADPQALGVVVAASQAFDYVGLPEGRYHLAHACLYLSTAPKSNSSMAFFDALASVTSEQNDDIPNPLRDASRDKEGLGHGKGYLYPHAWRDHWVAQQYLPDALQGKMFYEPADIGYERGIRDSVARRREAQLEISAGAADSALEPASIGNDTAFWIKRSGGDGGQVERVREIIFERAAIKPADLVLDIGARSGLLSCEAARQAVDGGVWTLVFDPRSQEVLKALTAGFDPLCRPQIVAVTPGAWVDALRTAAGGEVRFNAIVAYNALSHIVDKADFVGCCAGLLAPGGTIVIAQTVHRLGQRITELVGGDDSAVSAMLAAAEERLFTDPLVNWTPQGLAATLLAEKGITSRSFTVEFPAKRRLTPPEIDYWFREAGATERASLGDRLRTIGSPADVASIRQAVHARLDYKDIQWKTVVGFIEVRGEKAQGKRHKAKGIRDDADINKP